MPPKSSASSGTRKKHARKAAGPVEPEVPREKKGKKHRSDPPRQKVYVAPVKPSAAQPDPLETTGLAHRLPPELLVVLRSLGKKAPVTKVRALEELQSGWVERCGDEDGEGTTVYTLLDMLPVWLHHLPAHLVHPSRRIRLLTAGVHAALLRVPLLRGPLADDAPDNAAGTWALAAHDVDRAVAATAAAARVSPADPEASVLLAFVERTLMHPDALYAELNPPPPPAPPPPTSKRPTGMAEPPPVRAKADELDESESDRRARLRIAAFGALKYILETTPAPLPAFLEEPALWSALHHAAAPPFLDPGADEESGLGFGFAQPALRRAAWAALPAVLARRPLPPAVVPVLAHAVLRSAWVEPDGAVQGAMWGGLLGFLKDHPDAWTHTPRAYAEFCDAFLAKACGGAPVAAYPTVVVVLSTVPTEILAPIHTLFAAFWAALGGPPSLPPALASFDSGSPSSAVLAAVEAEAAAAAREVAREAEASATTPADVLEGADPASLNPSADEKTEAGAPIQATRKPTPAAAPALTTALPPARARAGAAFVSALLECALFVARRGRGAGGKKIWRPYTVIRPSGGVSYQESVDTGPGGEENEAQEENEEEDREEEEREAREEGARLFAREVGRVWGALAVGGTRGAHAGMENENAENEKEKENKQKEEKKDKTPLLHVEARRAAGLLRRALGSAGGVGVDILDAGLDALSACVRGARGDAALVCAVLEALVGEEEEEGKGDTHTHDTADAGREPAIDETKPTTDETKPTTDETKPTTDETKPPTDAETRKHDAEVRIRAAGRALRAEVLGAAVRTEDSTFLVRALATFGDRVFRDAAFTKALDALLASRAYALLLTAPALLFAYLTHRAPQRQALFHALLTNIAAHPEAAAEALRALVTPEATRALVGLSAVAPTDAGSSTATATDAAGPLDALFADEPPVPVPVLAQILQRAELFLSPRASHAALARVVAAFAARVETALAYSSDTDAEGRMPLWAFDADLELLGGVLAGRPDAVDAGALLPTVYVFAYVLPRAYPPEEREAGAVGVARNIWLQWREEGTADVRETVCKEVTRRLGVMVCSTDVCVTPEEILAALAEGTLGVPLDVVADVFPGQAELDAMLNALPADPPAASLAVLHPHLPPASAIRATKPAPAHDARGYAAYARIVAALLQALAADRRAAKEHVWALRHVLALALYAEDLRAVPAAVNPVFDAEAPGLDGVALVELAAHAQQVTTYLLTASTDDGWRARVIAALTSDKPLVGGGALPSLLVDLVACARRTDGSRDCRVLGGVLRHLLQDADKAEADLGMTFARKIEKSAPETCIAVVSAISASTLEPPRLERYRNELAADLLGIPASKANTQGLLTLRKLAASAPAGDSDVVFLPQQRSVNIFKACQQWIASDEDIEEELESAMTLVFFYLAPLLQNVPGTHWELIFDVLESNLENAALTDDETLVTLARTLRLIILIQDLTLTNKSLRADWEERQMGILTMVRDLAAGQLDGIAASAPRSTCRELVLSIMCHLLADPSVDVQKMTYQLLTIASRKRTEHFVIEAGVDVDAVVKADLPLELLDILQTSLNFNQGDLLDLDESTVFGYLLGWMVVFDLFPDASLKVRLSYIDQLRTLDIIGTSFIPNLLSLLGVDQGIPKAFKLDVWSVDEYFVPLYESGSVWSFQVLAAHLYYRALLTVPSLIYNWVLDCKDRQLSSSIATYTSLHFSPVIIRAELAHVKSPAVTAELVDENLTIKVATAVNEVVASYLVDEQQLEIKLKIPSDWPLHKIEVKDVQRVGVEETRWRAWILAVQQTLWSQNGRIVDGIGLFKKNVTLHFEGQVECAICYSIISVMDGHLPRKPCKTCKNRFHSGCLYKLKSFVELSIVPI
ncbi:hypothetical protein C8R44DRAFT_889801 [Mycena epipterygia]|nr:hypothetical protein C8R44DRAFT_889801 [Mycena epipterygia]